MPGPAELEREHTLLTAAARHDALRRRKLRTADDDADGTWTSKGEVDPAEALELLALSEVLVRKAGYGRQLTIRAARAAGASWDQIGEALQVSVENARSEHSRWIDEQAARHRLVSHEGMAPDEVRRARALAGPDKGT